MLPPCARGSVGVNTKVLFLDLDLDLVVDFRIDINRGEARMAAGGCIKWGNAHQPVHTALGIKLPVSIISLYQEGCGLYAGFVPLLVIEYLGSVTRALAPSKIHPRKHLRPILGFGSARPGMYRHNCVGAVVFSGEQYADFSFQRFLFEPFHLPAKVADYLLAFQGKFEERIEIRKVSLEPGVQLHIFFQTAPCLKRCLGFVLAEPELRQGYSLFDLGNLVPFTLCIKDNLESVLPSRQSHSLVPAILPTSRPPESQFLCSQLLWHLLECGSSLPLSLALLASRGQSASKLAHSTRAALLRLQALQAPRTSVMITHTFARTSPCCVYQVWSWTKPKRPTQTSSRSRPVAT